MACARGHFAQRARRFGLPRADFGKPLRKRFLAPLGLLAGFVDATGGGGWGPVGTPAILASGRLEPRKVIGSVDTSEFLVALAASTGFLVGIGSQNIDFTWVGVLLLGGILAAPIAAWLVRHIPPRILGSAVGGVIILTNLRTLLRSDWIAAPGGVQTLAYLAIALIWAGAITHSVRAYRRDKAAPPVESLEVELRPRESEPETARTPA
ncbi:sulfite exporter TauE/SafE family protein [Nonomuraea sp. NPDC004354]